MKEKILHFDDDHYLTEIYKAKFIEVGFDYKIFGTYNNLLEIVVKEKPDLIICDIVMPDIDGYEAMKILKNDKRTKDISIVVLSNMCDEENVKKAMDCGAIKFLCTSYYKPSELVQIIKEIIETNKTKNIFKNIIGKVSIGIYNIFKK